MEIPLPHILAWEKAKISPTFPFPIHFTTYTAFTNRSILSLPYVSYFYLPRTASPSAAPSLYVQWYNMRSLLPSPQYNLSQYSPINIVFTTYARNLYDMNSNWYPFHAPPCHTPACTNTYFCPTTFNPIHQNNSISFLKPWNRFSSVACPPQKI